MGPRLLGSTVFKLDLLIGRDSGETGYARPVADLWGFRVEVLGSNTMMPHGQGLQVLDRGTKRATRKLQIQLSRYAPKARRHPETLNPEP